jgi:aldehyde dehydrogenase (NAD+)
VTTLEGGRLYIGGQFRTAEAVQPVLEAATAQLLGDGASANHAEIDEAVAAARSALPAWQALTPEHRAHLMNRFSTALSERAAATSELVTVAFQPSCSTTTHSCL